MARYGCSALLAVWALAGTSFRRVGGLVPAATHNTRVSGASRSDVFPHKAAAVRFESTVSPGISHVVGRLQRSKLAHRGWFRNAFFAGTLLALVSVFAAEVFTQPGLSSAATRACNRNVRVWMLWLSAIAVQREI
jgi:hypothetical protein